MPGYVEGLVRVPLKQEGLEELSKRSEDIEPDIFGEPDVSAKDKDLVGLKYKGPHFGEEDSNVLAFFRGYEETLPNGKKAFHVIEVQSDWGQEVRKNQDKAKQMEGETWRSPAEREQWIQQRVEGKGHPLLAVYETLALKAAIDHARSVGADSIVLSDADTAMMTEGHDKAAEEIAVYPAGARVRVNSTGPDREAAIKAGATFERKPAQDAGMRLHYDTTLPSAMRKLTGQQGERVELGTHDKAKQTGQRAVWQNNPETGVLEKAADPVGSPVFRNPDGTPKSSITGTAYDLASAFRNLDAQDGFTVADPSRAPRWVPESFEDQRIVDAIKPERGGHGLREWLERSSDPVIKALAKDLKKFKESLSRVSVELADIAFEGDAQSNAVRNAKIRLNPNIFHTDQARAEVVVAHELLHGLSLAELDNPTNSKIVKELNAFRERLAQNLPRDLKARYDAAVKSDWISRYDGSNEMLQEIGSNWHDQQIVYGLLNNKELISQGFTAPEMRQFMQGLKADGGGWYNRFKNFVKRLVGIDEKQTAYDEFLSRSDALLQQGEWVSGFQNYAERYYEGLGLPQSVARSQATRALRLVMDSANGTSPELLLRSLDVPGLLKSTEINRAEVGLRMMKEEDQQQLMSVMDEQGLTSDRSGLDELVQEVAAGRIDPEVFDLLPPAASKYVFAKSNDMGEVLGSLQGALSEKNNGLINLAQPQMLRGPVKEANKMLERIASSERMSDEMVGRLAGLFAVSPDGFADLNSSKAPAWLQDTVEDVKDGAAGFGSWVKNFLQPTAQRARENPETAEAYTRGYQLQANVRKMATSALKIFGIDLTDPNGNVTAESTKQSANTLKNPRLERAVDHWIYLNQLEGRKTKSIQMLSPDHPEVKKLLSKFSFDEQKDIGQMVIKQVGSTEALNAMELQSMLDIAAARGAAIANVDNGLKTSQNIKLVSEMLRSMMDLNDPMKAGVAQQQLASLATRFADPQTFSDLLRFSENEIQAYRAWEELFKKNPAYANAQRQGKYLVDYTKNGKEFVGQAQSKAQGRLYVRERGGTNPRFRLNEKGTGYDLGTDASALIQRIKQLEENRIEILRSKGVPSDVLDAVRDAGIGTQLATEAANRGGIPSADARERRLTKGAEDLPYLENHFGHVFRRANYWSRQLFRAQMDAHVLEKEIADRPDLQTQLKTHRDNMLQTDSPTVQKINRFMSTWFLGFNPASALMNTLQPFTTHVAEFTSMTGKPFDSYRRVMRALDELAGGKSARTEEHNWLEKQAAQDGEVDLQMYDTDVATSDLVATNFMRLINSNRPQTIGQRLGSLAGNVQTAAFKMFRMTEKMNNLSALFASYDYYREQGLSREAARDKAYEFNHAVNFGGGRAQRPVGAFSGRSPVLRSAAMLGTALQSYVLGTTFQLARYLNKGLFRPAGTTPAETYAARKAVAQMLGTQLAAAGTLGLPFVSGAIALLDEKFPGLELNRNIRELMSSFFQEDEENGGTFTDIAMTGVPSMLGWDLQSRLSMGNTVPGVSEINGFQPELLAGPVASLASSFVNGGRKVASGDMGGLSSLTPPGVRKILELVKDQGQVRDYKDRPLFSPSPGETMGLALGFQPKRLSDLNAANRMLQQSEEVANRREGQWKQQQAEELLKGNFGTVRQALLERSANDKSYNPVDAARRVVQAAEELAFPRDLRREGVSNMGSVRSSILRSFGVSASAPSEMDRLKFRLGMEQRLGVPPSDRSAEAQLAQVMDSLPADLTRSERRRRAMILLRGQRAQPTLSLPQA